MPIRAPVIACRTGAKRLIGAGSASIESLPARRIGAQHKRTLNHVACPDTRGNLA